MEKLKNINLKNALISVVLLVLGVVLIINPQTIMPVIIRILSIFLVGYGIFDMVSYFVVPDEFKQYSTKLIQGIIELIFGLVALSYPLMVISAIYTIIGIWTIIASVYKLQLTYFERNNFAEWIFLVVTSILGIIVGVILVINPLIVSNYVNIFAGIFIVIEELLNIVESCYIAIKLN